MVSYYSMVRHQGKADYAILHFYIPNNNTQVVLSNAHQYQQVVFPAH